MYNPGDVVLANFAGAEHVKRRPALVLSSVLYQENRPDVILGLITSQTARANSPSDHVLQDWENAGLTHPSAFRTFLYTAPRSEVLAIIGHVSERDWIAIRNCVKISLADLDNSNQAVQDPE